MKPGLKRRLIVGEQALRSLAKSACAAKQVEYVHAEMPHSSDRNEFQTKPAENRTQGRSEPNSFANPPQFSRRSTGCQKPHIQQYGDLNLAMTTISHRVKPVKLDKMPWLCCAAPTFSAATASATGTSGPQPLVDLDYFNLLNLTQEDLITKAQLKRMRMPFPRAAATPRSKAGLYEAFVSLL